VLYVTGMFKEWCVLYVTGIFKRSSACYVLQGCLRGVERVVYERDV